MDHVITGEVQGIGSITGDVSGGGSVSGGISVFDTPPYAGPYEVDASEQDQTLETNGRKMLHDVSVGGIPAGYVGSEVPRRSSSDLSANGATVTAPAGYYDQTASKAVQSGHAEVVDSEIVANPTITVSDSGLIMASVSKTQEIQIDVDEGYVASGSNGQAVVIGEATSQLPLKTSADLSTDGSVVTAPAGYYAEAAQKAIPDATLQNGSGTINPVLSVDYSTGEITATNSGTLSVSPIAQSGYAETSDSVSVGISGSAEAQLNTKGAEVFTPSNQAQTILAGQLLIGDQTIKAVAPPFYDMSVANAWMGAGAELVQTFTLADVKLSATSFASWTPSTTAKDILATRTAGSFTATDMENYDYFLCWDTKIPIVYQEGAVDKARGLFLSAFHVQALCMRASSYENYKAQNQNSNVCVTAFSGGNFYRYYGSTQGTITYTNSASYGFYGTVTAATFSSSTAASPTVTVKSPKVTARCSTTYLSTGNAALIDQAKTIISQKCLVYRVKKPAFMQGCWNNIMRLINEIDP